jgi:hypothetical protein
MAVQVGLLTCNVRRDKKWKAAQDADKAECDKLMIEYSDLFQ